MTREQKLALIIGFSLVLLVGVLVSDHLSGARNAHLAEVGDALAESSPPEFVDPLPESVATNEPVEKIAPAPETRPAPPADLRVADTGSSPSETFINNLRQRWAANGAAIPAAQPEPRVIHTEPAVADPLVHDTRTTAVQTYRIKPGDSLWAIADRHYGDSDLAKKLADYNVQRGRLRDADTIRVGSSILLPEPRALGSIAPARTAQAPARTPRTYTVRSGDTLGEIAQKQLGSAKRVEAILSANTSLIDDPDDIRVGMVLALPAS